MRGKDRRAIEGQESCRGGNGIGFDNTRSHRLYQAAFRAHVAMATLAALEKAKDRSANGKGRGRCSTTITRKWYARITALFAGLLGYSVTLNGKYRDG